VDWAALRAAAAQAASRAYAPYSGLKVGAAALVDGGETVVGCNVENASFGVTLCAECGVVSALYAAGHDGRALAVAVCDLDGSYLPPCGRCRQLLSEVGGPDLLVNERPMSAWLPSAFSAAELDSDGD
jgi:cytidine deaminase